MIPVPDSVAAEAVKEPAETRPEMGEKMHKAIRMTANVADLIPRNWITNLQA